MSALSLVLNMFRSQPVIEVVEARSPRPVRTTIRSSFFTGGDTGRLFNDWGPITASPDQEVRWQFRFLRARARDLVKNDPYGVGFVNELSNQVVGPDGILFQAKIKSGGGTLATKTNAELERGWGEWGEPETATADGQEGWVEVQQLIVKTLPADGEVFLRKLRGFDNPYGYALQFIDADLVDEYYNLPASPGRNEIRMGVEIDRYNRPVAYHIWTRYQSDTNAGVRERLRIPADEIIHLFVRYRPNQTRGVSWFAPILAPLHTFGQYEFSTLVAQRTGAAKMGFLENVSDAAIEAYSPPTTDEDPRVMDVDPGLIQELPPGQTFKEFDPGAPPTSYGEYTSTVLRGVARGLNMSYSTLTGDLSKANYGSQRGGLLAERDHYRTIQQFLIRKLCRVVYRDWLRYALLGGAVRVDSRLASNYYDVAWKPRGFKWIDPEKDLAAAEREIKLGLNSRQRLAAENGLDYEEVIDELAYEQEYADEKGVDISGEDAPAAPAPGRPGAPPSADDPEKPSARVLSLAGAEG